MMCAIPRASAASVLLCIADSAARACQASRQIAEALLGLREIDGGTIGIEGVRSTLFNVGLYQ